MPNIIKTLTASFFRPTTSLTGNEQPSVFRGENMVMRGLYGNPYFEVFGGNRSLGEDYNAVPLTGRLYYTVGNPIVNGAGTQFLSELHIGQMITSVEAVFVVEEVFSDTAFRAARAPDSTHFDEFAYRLPQLFEVNGKRGVMLSGNAVQLPKGHYVAVGSGVLHINGQPLQGQSLQANSRPQVAIYRSATNDYIVRQLGFDAVPAKPTVSVVGGGTKGMTAGNKHSFMISFWSAPPEGTDGYSNPSEVIKTDAGGAPIQITADNNRFEFDFTPSLAGAPSNASGFIVWASLAGKKTVSSQTTSAGTTTSTSSPNETNYENGAWYKAKKIKFSELSANKYTFDYLDAELGEEVTGNNQSPTDCEFVSLMEGKPLYISCYGKRKIPGPSVVVSKFANPDAAPAEWSASLPNDIIGFFEGVGRTFLMTRSTLDFAVATGLLGSSAMGGQNLELPVVSRPYWKTGASNRYSIILVDDTLYGFSGGKLFKSVGNGDENVQKYEFGGPVEDITRNWSAGHELTAYDAKNNNVCFIYSGAYRNAAGYWVSVILPYSLFRDAWLPFVVLTSDTRDMIVSGAAVVAERMHFLCGGRGADGSYKVSTYLFDEPDAVNPVISMPYYLVWQPSDDGAENQSKQIHSIRPEGKFTNATIQIHGARPGGELKVTDMEKGQNALAPDIAVPDTSQITRYLEKRVKIKNLANYAVRISGNWNGQGIKDRIDELAVEVDLHGRKR